MFVSCVLCLEYILLQNHFYLWLHSSPWNFLRIIKLHIFLIIFFHFLWVIIYKFIKVIDIKISEISISSSKSMLNYLSIHLDSTRSNPFDIQLDILPLGIMIFTKMNLNPFLGILSILPSYSHAFYISCHITSNSLELVYPNFSHVLQ